MPVSLRVSMFTLCGLLASGSLACNAVPYPTFRQAQYRAWQLSQQNQMLASERNQLMSDRQQLEQRAAALESSLSAANSRLDNLNSERSQLQQKVVSLMNRAGNQKSPLSNDATRRLEDLKRRYPDFDFDPATGVSKFSNDILFPSGSAEIKPNALPLLNEFAAIMNQGDARALNILVVGHTDDQAISKQATANRHPTNWHLSTNRANSVVLMLSKAGLKEGRMGAAGYSKYQPVTANKDPGARQKNRRVEIFVLAPDASVAGWDPAINLN